MIASGKALKVLQERYYQQDTIASLFVLHANELPMQGLLNDLALPIATEINILDPDEIIRGRRRFANGRLPQGGV